VFVAQVPERAIVRNVSVEGNSKTKTSIITRELTLKIGDTIPLSNLSAKLEENRLRLMNTNLFNSVQINVKNWTSDDSCTVAIKVVENWYFYPTPIFELADRNWNVWWNEMNRSLKRTNYGMRLTHTNIMGRRDPLSALVQFGYTPKFNLSYNRPFVNKKQTIGVFGSVYYAVNRELGFATEGDKQTFYNSLDKRVMLRRFSTTFGMTHTPKLLSNHSAYVNYQNYSIDTAISQRLNPNYYNDGARQQRYFSLAYSYNHDNRDIRPYPKHGHNINFDILKSGLTPWDNVNTLDISLRFAKYTPLSKWLTWETILKGKTAVFRQNRPYNLQRALGFGSDFIRGYEYYIVDGYDYAFAKNSLRFEIINREYDLSPFLIWDKLKGFRSFPVKASFTTNFDAGYVNAPQYFYKNRFPNRLLYGGGVGLDLVIYYSIVFRMEYSWNHLGERGFYLRN
jgi:outer membrane protein assembly factor BamA